MRIASVTVLCNLYVQDIHGKPSLTSPETFYSGALEDAAKEIGQDSIYHKLFEGLILNQSSNLPMEGVTVKLQRTGKTSQTNKNGFFELRDVSDTDMIELTAVGIQPQMLKIKQAKIIYLTASEQELDEVVVTALGLKREEKSLGYAVQEIKGEDLQRVKGVDVGTTLTGRIAGLRVYNSTEFNAMPSISLRGMTPILVIDGVAYRNMNLRDIPVDNIEELTVLKGATATALYGSMGSGGAIMITTKKGLKLNGVQISFHSNNLFFAGYLALPQVQSAYSSGYNGKYNTDDYVWGDKLDIGRIYSQWNPISKTYEEQELTSRGKNNFNHFLEAGIISNTSVNFTTQSDYGSLTTSISHVYNKGQYPNTQLNMTNISVAGETRFSKRLNLETRLAYNRRNVPNEFGAGYNNQGYIYNILVWTGPEYDLRDYRDYWLVENEQQNWHYSAWYDNPYLSAYEKLSSSLVNKFNAALTLNYQVTDWAKFILRSGYDFYGNTRAQQNPSGIFGTRGGYSGFHANGKYYTSKTDGFSTTNDFLFMVNKNVSDFNFQGLLGATVLYQKSNSITASTQNGLSIPGFYSLRSSVDPITTAEGKSQQMVNSLYGRMELSWKNAIFLEATGRNDWSSTLPVDSRSYFYPSLSNSIVFSDLIKMPKLIDLLKLRSSWAISKSIPGPFAINQAFSVSNNSWDGLSTAAYPNSIKDYSISPTQRSSYEIGVDFSLFKKRLYGNYTRYYRILSNRQVYATISSGTGFSSRMINSQEEIITKGHEITLGGQLLNKNNFKWNISGNLSQNFNYYHKLDDEYSSDNLWVKKGLRNDPYIIRDWQHSPDGQIIHNHAGARLASQYNEQIGYLAPKWFWGLTNSFQFHNFNLSFSIDGRIGGLSYSATNARLWQTGSHIDSDSPERYEEVVNGNRTFIGAGVKIVSGSVEYDKYGQIVQDTRVFEPNDAVVSYETYWRRSYSGRQNVWDETFIKLRELSLSYQVPKSYAQRLGFKKATLGLTGQNLLLWTKEYRFADPDVASDDLNSPSVRYVGFNINFSF